MPYGLLLFSFTYYFSTPGSAASTLPVRQVAAIAATYDRSPAGPADPGPRSPAGVRRAWLSARSQWLHCRGPAGRRSDRTSLSGHELES